MNRTWKFALALLVCIAAWSASAVMAGQDPPTQTFRSGVDLLQLDVTVLDAERRPVHGLTAKDFTILVDGKAQPIQVLTEVRLPVRPASGPAWMTDVAPDIVSNMRPDAGRVIMIMVDPRWSLEVNVFAQRIARAVVAELGPSDLATLMYSMRLPYRVTPGLTNDRAQLLAAIDDMPMAAGETELDAICYCGTCIHEAMIRAADSVRELWRQKTMFVMGQSIVLQTRDSKCSTIVTDARKRLFTALDRSNMTIHYLDPIGLRTLATTAAQGLSAPPLAVYGERAMAELLRAGNLRELTALTGGRSVGSNFAELEVPSIFAESASYYLAGIKPPVPRKDGQDVKIEVAVRQEGLLVNARHTWIPPGPSKFIKSEDLPTDVPKPLWETMATTWPSNGRPLTLTAAPVALLPSGEIALAAVIEAHWTPPIGRSSAPARPGTIEVVAGAFDRDGKSLATHYQTIALPESVSMRPTGEFEVVSRLLVKPGLQEVRVALRAADGSPAGSVYANVDVPDFKKNNISLSAIVLGAAPGALSATADLLENLLPFAPTARRTFTRRDEVSGLVRVFQRNEDTPQPIHLSLAIRGEDNAVIVDQPATLEAGAFAEHSASHRFDLPLDTLRPGEYLLTIEGVRGEHRAKRELRFRVQ